MMTIMMRSGMSRYEEIKSYLWQNSLEPDSIAQVLFKDWDELFTMERPEYEAWQLKAAGQRFEALRLSVRALANQAESVHITGIEHFEDIVPLLFQHTQYKSYPLSLLEKGRFDMLTKWLDGLTSIDLSGVDVSGCEGIDHWLEMLEQQTCLRILHTSGTTGKLSFYPRTGMERDLWMLGLIKCFEGFADESGIKLGFDHVRLPCIYPSVRHGRYTSQRMVQFFEGYIAPTPEQCYTLSNGTLSADLVSLSGRVRVAQAKGELDKFQLSDSMRTAFKRYLEELERQPEDVNNFMSRMMAELKGEQVFMASTTGYLVKAAQEGLKRGVRQVFSPDSVGSVGGGGKGMELPDSWVDIVEEFTGVKEWSNGYGMTELTGSMRLCSEGYFHAQPYVICFLLDPESGKLLPREGTQTGRFAFLDLLIQTFWGGVVTGDKLTIDWDADCTCGRKGHRIHNNVTRYSEQVTGDDKVTCSATVDNTDDALQALLAVK
jgi:hypothetical protein